MQCRSCGGELFAGALFCAECGTAVAVSPAPKEVAPVESGQGAPRRLMISGGIIDTSELTVPRITLKPRYTLCFPDGTTRAVSGPGLLGRRPRPEPGEEFAEIVTISNDERTVSKTHIEFGFDSQQLWISDRYSGNGTVVVAPDGERELLNPGRRYKVARGTVLELGRFHITVE